MGISGEQTRSFWRVHKLKIPGSSLHQASYRAGRLPLQPERRLTCHEDGESYDLAASLRSIFATWKELV
jgi:hypothetical protein